MKKILVILILLSLDLYPDSLAKLKMACDIGNEKACAKLEDLQKRKVSTLQRSSNDLSKSKTINNNGSSRYRNKPCPTPNPHSVNIWKNYRVPTLKEAGEWMCAGFRSIDARDWKRAGVSTPAEAREWSKLGIRYSDIGKLKRINIRTIPEAKLWVQVGVKAGLIKYWKEKGVNSPEEAYKWIQADINSRDVREWKDTGVSSEEAKQWKDSGITGLSEVKNWKKIGVDAKDASQWKKIGLNIWGAKGWIRGGVSTADEVEKWVNIGVNRVSSVKEWKSSGVLTSEKAKEWIDADFRNGYFWAKEGFDIEQAKKWKEAGLNDGYSYYKDGIKTITEALFAKKCKVPMSYDIFNKKESGVLYGTIIQSLPNAYLVDSRDEIYYIPKFDGKLRDTTNYIYWRVASKGSTFTYNSTGNGVMQVAKVFYVFPDKDECNKYVPLKQ